MQIICYERQDHDFFCPVTGQPVYDDMGGSVAPRRWPFFRAITLGLVLILVAGCAVKPDPLVMSAPQEVEIEAPAALTWAALVASYADLGIPIGNSDRAGLVLR